MSNQSGSNESELPLEVVQACQYLRQFNCLQPRGRDPQDCEDWEKMQQAVLLVAEASDDQILGICADTLEQGIHTLATYAAALNYSPNLSLPTLESAVYIKFNPKTGLCYATAYDGNHRGVLVSCQSDQGGVNEMFGHLPLNLFSAS